MSCDELSENFLMVLECVIWETKSKVCAEVIEVLFRMVRERIQELRAAKLRPTKTLA